MTQIPFTSLSFSCPADKDGKEVGTDNRNISDDGKSQKLTRDDIETLKEQGLKGQVGAKHSHYVCLFSFAVLASD